jgi:hypothetical protein
MEAGGISSDDDDDDQPDFELETIVQTYLITVGQQTGQEWIL